MAIKASCVTLPDDVGFDDYEGHGMILDLRLGVVKFLDPTETAMFSTLLSDSTCPMKDHQGASAADLQMFLQRMVDQHYLVPQGDASSRCRPYPIPHVAIPCPQRISWRQRVKGAGHMLSVLNELRKPGDGIAKASQYLSALCSEQQGRFIVDTSQAFSLAQAEYWWYRLMTGMWENRVATLLGQGPDKGLCLVRAFALCTYLLSLQIPASIVIARPKYGTRQFLLHAWVELQGMPVNEFPNVREGYRILYQIPRS